MFLQCRRPHDLRWLSLLWRRCSVKSDEHSNGSVTLRTPIPGAFKRLFEEIVSSGERRRVSKTQPDTPMTQSSSFLLAFVFFSLFLQRQKITAPETNWCTASTHAQSYRTGTPPFGVVGRVFLCSTPSVRDKRRDVWKGIRREPRKTDEDGDSAAFNQTNKNEKNGERETGGLKAKRATRQKKI